MSQQKHFQRNARLNKADKSHNKSETNSQVSVKNSVQGNSTQKTNIIIKEQTQSIAQFYVQDKSLFVLSALTRQNVRKVIGTNKSEMQILLKDKMLRQDLKKEYNRISKLRTDNKYKDENDVEMLLLSLNGLINSIDQIIKDHNNLTEEKVVTKSTVRLNQQKEVMKQINLIEEQFKLNNILTAKSTIQTLLKRYAKDELLAQKLPFYNYIMFLQEEYEKEAAVSKDISNYIEKLSSFDQTDANTINQSVITLKGLKKQLNLSLNKQNKKIEPSAKIISLINQIDKIDNLLIASIEPKIEKKELKSKRQMELEKEVLEKAKALQLVEEGLKFCRQLWQKTSQNKEQLFKQLDLLKKNKKKSGEAPYNLLIKLYDLVNASRRQVSETNVYLKSVGQLYQKKTLNVENLQLQIKKVEQKYGANEVLMGVKSNLEMFVTNVQERQKWANNNQSFELEINKLKTENQKLSQSIEQYKLKPARENDFYKNRPVQKYVDDILDIREKKLEGRGPKDNEKLKQQKEQKQISKALDNIIASLSQKKFKISKNSIVLFTKKYEEANNPALTKYIQMINIIQSILTDIETFELNISERQKKQKSNSLLVEKQKNEDKQKLKDSEEYQTFIKAFIEGYNSKEAGGLKKMFDELRRDRKRINQEKYSFLLKLQEPLLKNRKKSQSFENNQTKNMINLSLSSMSNDNEVEKLIRQKAQLTQSLAKERAKVEELDAKIKSSSSQAPNKEIEELLNLINRIEKGGEWWKFIPKALNNSKFKSVYRILQKNRENELQLEKFRVNEAIYIEQGERSSTLSKAIEVILELIQGEQYFTNEDFWQKKMIKFKGNILCDKFVYSLRLISNKYRQRIEKQVQKHTKLKTKFESEVIKLQAVKQPSNTKNEQGSSRKSVDLQGSRRVSRSKEKDNMQQVLNQYAEQQKVMLKKMQEYQKQKYDYMIRIDEIESLMRQSQTFEKQARQNVEGKLYEAEQKNIQLISRLNQLQGQVEILQSRHKQTQSKLQQEIGYYIQMNKTMNKEIATFTKLEVQFQASIQELQKEINQLKYVQKAGSLDFVEVEKERDHYRQLYSQLLREVKENQSTINTITERTQLIQSYLENTREQKQSTETVQVQQHSHEHELILTREIQNAVTETRMKYENEIFPQMLTIQKAKWQVEMNSSIQLQLREYQQLQLPKILQVNHHLWIQQQQIDWGFKVKEIESYWLNELQIKELEYRVRVQGFQRQLSNRSGVEKQLNQVDLLELLRQQKNGSVVSILIDQKWSEWQAKKEEQIKLKIQENDRYWLDLVIPGKRQEWQKEVKTLQKAVKSEDEIINQWKLKNMPLIRQQWQKESQLLQKVVKSEDEIITQWRIKNMHIIIQEWKAKEQQKASHLHQQVVKSEDDIINQWKINNIPRIIQEWKANNLQKLLNEQKVINEYQFKEQWVAINQPLIIQEWKANNLQQLLNEQKVINEHYFKEQWVAFHQPLIIQEWKRDNLPQIIKQLQLNQQPSQSSHIDEILQQWKIVNIPLIIQEWKQSYVPLILQAERDNLRSQLSEELSKGKNEIIEQWKGIYLLNIIQFQQQKAVEYYINHHLPIILSQQRSKWQEKGGQQLRHQQIQIIIAEKQSLWQLVKLQQIKMLQLQFQTRQNQIQRKLNQQILEYQQKYIQEKSKSTESVDSAILRVKNTQFPSILEKEREIWVIKQKDAEEKRMSAKEQEFRHILAELEHQHRIKEQFMEDQSKKFYDFWQAQIQSSQIIKQQMQKSSQYYTSNMNKMMKQFTRYSEIESNSIVSEEKKVKQIQEYWLSVVIPEKEAQWKKNQEILIKNKVTELEYEFTQREIPRVILQQRSRCQQKAKTQQRQFDESINYLNQQLNTSFLKINEQKQQIQHLQVSYKEIYNKYQQQIKEVNPSINKEVIQLTKRLQNSQHQLSIVTREQEKSYLQVNQYTQQKHHLQIEIKDAKNKMDYYQQQIVIFTRQNENIKREVYESNERINKENTKYHNLQQNLQDYKRIISIQKDDLKKLSILSMDNDRLTKEILNLKESYNNMETSKKKEIHELRDMFQHKISELNNQKNTFFLKINQLEKNYQNQTEKQKSQAIQSLERQLSTLTSTLKTKENELLFMKKTVESTTIECRDLRKQFLEQVEKRRIIQTNISELKSTRMELEYEIKYLKERQGSLSRKLQSKEEQFLNFKKRSDSEIELFERKLRSSLQLSSSLQIKNAELQSVLSIKLKEGQGSVSDIERYKGQINRLQSKLKATSEDNDFMKRQLRQLQSHRIKQKMEHQYALEEINQLKTQLNQQTHKSNDLSQKIEGLNTALNQKDSQRETQRRKYQFQRREKEDHFSKMQLERREKDELIAKLQIQSRQKDEYISKMQVQFSNIERSYRRQVERIEILEREIESKEEDVEEIEVLNKINKDVSNLTSINRQLETKCILLENRERITQITTEIVNYFLLIQKHTENLVNHLHQDNIISDFEIYHQFYNHSKILLSNGKILEYFVRWEQFIRNLFVLIEAHKSESIENKERELNNLKEEMNQILERQIEQSEKVEGEGERMQQYKLIVSDITTLVQEYMRTSDEQYLRILCNSLGIVIKAN